MMPEPLPIAEKTPTIARLSSQRTLATNLGTRLTPRTPKPKGQTTLHRCGERPHKCRKFKKFAALERFGCVAQPEHWQTRRNVIRRGSFRSVVPGAGLEPALALRRKGF